MHEPAHDGAQIGTRPGDVVQLGAFGVAHLTLQRGQARCEGRRLVLRQLVRGSLLEQLLQADAGFTVERRSHELVLGHAHGVDEDEVRLRLGIRRHGLEVRLRDRARTPALHLLEVLPGADVAHEDDALQRFHVRAGRDHVDRHRDT